MLHGMTGSREKMLPLARRLAPEGWNLLVPDAPFRHRRGGFAWWVGDTPPEGPIGAEAAAQLEESVRILQSQIPTDGPLIVGGFSQGAAVAQELLLTEMGSRIIGVVVLGSRAARPLLLMESLSLLPPQRMLSMHGERDHLVSPQQGEECASLYEDAGWTVERIRHHKGHMVDLANEVRVRGWLEETARKCTL